MSWLWGKKQDKDDDVEGESVDNDAAVDVTEKYIEQNNYNDDNDMLHEGEIASSDEGDNDDMRTSSDESDATPGDGNNHNDITAQQKSLPHNMSLESVTTDEDDDISMIDDSSGVDSLDDDSLGSSSDEDDEKEEMERSKTHDSNSMSPSKMQPRLDHATPINGDKSLQYSSHIEEKGTADDDEEEEVPTSFWEKQSLLILAAEHDRVDILKGILSDEDDEKERLMNSGIPPLHLSITFGSVNATVALLRMGADPSVRPNINKIFEEQNDQPDDSKVEIPNITRFDGVSAWELAFGNQYFEEAMLFKKSKSWSLFGTSSSLSNDDNSKTKMNTSTRVVKPVDITPSKREGVRHAFTAEALRSIGSDEVQRLGQLLDSGMPASIDIGGKDLYGWAVEMGAFKCEELLRPSEAAKYESRDEKEVPNDSIEPTGEAPTENPEENGSLPVKQHPSFVIHRPTEETIPQLNNRLDELESLAAALSTCLDNLAEEVSVCHGLLLMGGGASALASHVKSLKALKTQKYAQLEEAHRECTDFERELANLVCSSGDVGREIANTAAFKLFNGNSTVDGGLKKCSERPRTTTPRELEVERKSLLAQIAASENKIRKIRSSIADLSEENARDMKEVERRGLEGGINLVRGLREEIRDVDFQLGEIRSIKMECKTKISMIHARISSQHHSMNSSAMKSTTDSISAANTSTCCPTSDTIETKTAQALQRNAHTEDHSGDPSIISLRGSSNNLTSVDRAEPYESSTFISNGLTMKQDITISIPPPDTTGKMDSKQKADIQMTPSEKIANGDSQAIAVVQPGNHGFFTVDLWQVLLRIIGMDRAAYRRGVQVASTRPNVLIV